jgi:hypothetical protein
VGTSHVIALTEDGRVYGWGSNLFGSLGTGTDPYSAVPVRVYRGEYPGDQFLGDNTFLPVQDVAAAEDFSIAIVDTCDVYGWGHNQRLQLVESSLQDHNTPIRIPGIGEEGPSSVDFASFTAYLNTYLVELRWRTISEFRVARFDLQRKIDEEDWTTLTSLPGHGSSSQPFDYAHDDDISELLGSSHTLKYRLKYIGVDGVATVADSAIIQLMPSSVTSEYTYEALQLSISPSPATTWAHIGYYLPAPSTVHIDLIDKTGIRVQEVVHGTESAGTHHTTVNVENLPSGIYLCRINAGQTHRTCWLVVTK